MSAQVFTFPAHVSNMPPRLFFGGGGSVNMLGERAYTRVRFGEPKPGEYYLAPWLADAGIHIAILRRPSDPKLVRPVLILSPEQE